MEALQRYKWPGNVREVRNTVERAVILATGPRLYIRPPASTSTNGSTNLLLADAEREHLRTVLEMTGWRIRGKDGAAEILGLKPTTLDSLMMRLGIARKSSPDPN